MFICSIYIGLIVWDHFTLKLLPYFVTKRCFHVSHSPEVSSVKAGGFRQLGFDTTKEF